jgi:hypothetical protein
MKSTSNVICYNNKVGTSIYCKKLSSDCIMRHIIVWLLFFFKKVAQDVFEECEKVSYNQMETIPRGEDHFHKEQITLCAQVKVMWW